MARGVVQPVERGRRVGPAASIAAAAAVSVLIGLGVSAAQAAEAPFPYVWAKAFHIPPETTTEESLFPL